MAYGAKQKNDVRRYYALRVLPMTEAAKLANVPVGTARRWKDQAKERGDDWDEARAAAAISAGGRDDLMKSIINDFVVMQQCIMESLRDPANKMTPKEKIDSLASLADAFSKTMKSAGQASPELSKLSVANDIIQLLGDFVAKEFPQHVPAFIEILEPFGEEISRSYGR